MTAQTEAKMTAINVHLDLCTRRNEPERDEERRRERSRIDQIGVDNAKLDQNVVTGRYDINDQPPERDQQYNV